MTQTAKARPWRTIFRYIIPLIISVGLCYLLFTGVDFRQMWDKMGQCDFWWIGVSLALSIFAQIFRAVRWRMQLRALGIDPPLHTMICSIFGTYAVNLVFPRLGEVWRTGYIAQRQQAPFAEVFGSMVADRLADTVTVFLMTVAVFLLARDAIVTYMIEIEIYDRIQALISSPWLWIIGLLLVAGLVCFLHVRRHTPLVQRLRNLYLGLWEGFAGIMKMPRKGIWLLFTVLIWGSYFVEMWLAFYSFRETGDYVAAHGILAVFVTFIFGSLAMGVPANGGIGPWQWAVMIAITDVYGIMNRTDALAFANVVLGTQTILMILLGLYTFIAIALDKRHNPRMQ